MWVTRLRIDRWVPRGIEDDDARGSGQVKALPARTRRDQEEAQLQVGVGEVRDHQIAAVAHDETRRDEQSRLEPQNGNGSTGALAGEDSQPRGWRVETRRVGARRVGSAPVLRVDRAVEAQVVEAALPADGVDVARRRLELEDFFEHRERLERLRWPPSSYPRPWLPGNPVTHRNLCMIDRNLCMYKLYFSFENAENPFHFYF